MSLVSLVFTAIVFLIYTVLLWVAWNNGGSVLMRGSRITFLQAACVVAVAWTLIQGDWIGLRAILASLG